MAVYPLTTLATILVLILYAAFGALVSRARVTLVVRAPATIGHPDFERRFRVHMNTLEQMAILLPLIWLCAVWVGDQWAGLGGLIWCIGRVVYARAYYRNAEKRDIGFYIGAAPVVAMVAAVIVSVAMRWAQV